MKRFLTALLAVCMLLVTAGCAGKEQPKAEPTAGPTYEGSDGKLELGDTMPELKVTTAQGETLVLSQLLQEKKLVVLNFWFANCSWCRKEFLPMEVAYQRVREDVEILAVNPVDSAGDIKTFHEQNGYSFPMAGCSRDLALALGVGGYPTSVFIDRTGTISLIHAGAITDTAIFDQVFAAFTAEDYTPTLYHSLGEVIAERGA